MYLLGDNRNITRNIGLRIGWLSFCPLYSIFCNRNYFSQYKKRSWDLQGSLSWNADVTEYHHPHIID